MERNLTAEDDDKSTFKILIASDCHLGCHEEDPDRIEDSMVTFKEILQIAQLEDVDFILLGGDMYHESNPAPWALSESIGLIRKYCMGGKPVQFDILNDQQENFNRQNRSAITNFRDPFMRVSCPIFSIHGCHDNPVGIDVMGPLDVLSAAGFLNQFGKYLNLDSVEIEPILLQKDTTKLALFGFGAIEDGKIHQLFAKEKVQMLRPNEDADSWFNMMVLHQSRAHRGPNGCTLEQFLPDFLDLVLWGHEHECKIAPEKSTGGKRFMITQPGSTVATTLCAGEAVPKKVGILRIKGKQFGITPVPVQTVRQLNHREVHWNAIMDWILARAAAEHLGNPLQPQKPLFVLVSPGLQAFNDLPVDREATVDASQAVNDHIFERMRADLIKEAGGDDERKEFFLDLCTACRESVEKDNTSAIGDVVERRLKMRLQKLEQAYVSDDESSDDEEGDRSIQNVLDASRSQQGSRHAEGDSRVDDDLSMPTTSRGGGAGRSSRSRERGDGEEKEKSPASDSSSPPPSTGVSSTMAAGTATPPSAKK